MRLDDFHYSLRDALVAQEPASVREEARLLRILHERCEHMSFRDFPELLRPKDVLVVNDTRVIRARLRGEKDSGGRAELMVERIERETDALCQVRVSKRLKAGRFVVVDGERIEVMAREGEFYRLRFPEPVLAFLERHGEVPLPPYIGRQVRPEDAERYQTVYGASPGAVAAPTAGLHFTECILDEIRSRGVAVESVTLHVGAGTFQPVRVQELQQHAMHAEHYEVTAGAAASINERRRDGGRVVAVGTTVVRTLETAVSEEGEVSAGRGETRLFITPGFRFRTVDALLTNFHLPGSTLLMLVCAFGGYERVMSAYETAVGEAYRFFSYGDACFLERMHDV